MPDNEEHTEVGSVIVKVNGTELPVGVAVMLQEVVVDQSLHIPSMFTILIDDPDIVIIDDDTFAFAKEVEIKAVETGGSEISLIKGEITGLEPTFDNGGQQNTFLVRGYDNSHKLHRQSKTKAWLNKTDSQIAEAIAGEAGLQAEVTSTSTTYKHVFQDNQTDMEFLQGRAWRIGFECFATEGKLYFRKPDQTLGSPVTLTADVNLISFSPSARVSEQVSSVVVKGWDPVQKAAIQGQANGKGDYQPSIALKEGHEAAGDYFGSSELVIVDQPLESQAEGDEMAKARLNERSGTFINAEGTAFRTPSIKAGNLVTIEGLGTRFSGDYKVTTATHIWNSQGWITRFEVSGLRTNLLSESINHNRPLNRWPGVVTALVDNVEDPEGMGRVMVRYPWMADSEKSCWARVTGIGAGPDAGYFVIPQVGDEVVVAFEFGDINRPVVIGGLWNGSDKPPPMVKHDRDAPKIRTWTSTDGHHITMYDTADKKIEIVSKAGQSIVIDDQNKKIEMKSSGNHQVVLDERAGGTVEISGKDLKIKAQNINAEAVANVEIKANGNMKLQATGNIDIQATGMVNIKGQMINLG